MKHIIIGTAGHIDHGKTALIKALTGRDTDTIKEEKQRGISIDLGFTYFDLPDGMRSGIIDVPGHEKFLPNMLAGVCGMDLVLLVIALDEGIKPQTLEHMEILSQLGVPQGIVVLTKVDCVEQDWADLIEEEVMEVLENTVFSEWPLIRVSSIRGDGIEELKKRIVAMAGDVEAHGNRNGAFRMPVDRVMSLDGLGTVVAGTVLDGTAKSGETIELYPDGQCARIRSIQTHGVTVDHAEAGQRAALLVAGIKKEEVHRGDVAADPDTLTVSERLDVKLTLAEGTKRVLKNQMRVHLHIGAAQLLCRVILFGCEELHAGESCYAQLYLEGKAAVKKKDRFIIRFYSPAETIGGGFVLDECAKKHKRTDGRVLARMQQLEENREAQILLDYICQESERPVSNSTVEKMLGIKGQELASVLESIERDVIVLSGKKERYYASCAVMEKWKNQALEWMENYHERCPYRKGVERDCLKTAVFRKWDREPFDALLNYLIQHEWLCRGKDGEKDIIRKGDFRIIRDERFIKCAAMLKKTLSKASFQFLDYRELRPEKMTEEMYEDIVAELERQHELVRISEIFYTIPELVQEVIEEVEKYFRQNEVITYTVLRNLLQTTRRSVKPLVAYLDALQITAPGKGETERYRGGGASL